MSSFGSRTPIVETPAPAFERLSLYDTPGVYIDNAIRGRLFEAGRSPATMTPNDRLELADRIKADLGIDNPVIGALVEVASNPWVWAATASSFVFGAGSIGRSAKTLFTPAHKHMVEVRKHGNLLAEFAPVFGAREELMGSSILNSLEEITKGRRVFASGEALETAALNRAHVAREKILAAHPGAKTLADIDGGKLNRVLQAKLAGLDQNRVEKVAKWVPGKDGATGKVVVESVEMGRIMDPDAVDGYLRRFGADELVAETRGAYEDIFNALYGKANGKGSFVRDAAGNVEVDTDKVLRVFRGYRKPLMGLKNSRMHEGVGVHSNLLDPEVARAVEAGALSEKEFLKFVKDSIPQQTFYAPMNSSRFYRRTTTGGLQEIGRVDLARETDAAINSLKGTASAVTRKGQTLKHWDTDDLQEIREFARSPEAYDNWRKNMNASMGNRTRIREGSDRNAFVRFQSLDFENSFTKHVNQSARTHAVFSQEAPAELVEAFNTNMKRVEEAAGLKVGVYEDPRLFASQRAEVKFDPSITGKKRSVLDGVGPDNAPAGGYSVADLLSANYDLVPAGNSTLRDAVAHTYVPLVMGRKDVQQGLLTSIVQNTKFRAQDFVDRNGISRALRDSGGLGKSLVSRIEKFAKEPIVDPQGFDAGLAGAFYGGTLGANLATILLNSTQPLLTTSRLVRMDDLAVAYKEAFADMSSYAAARAKIPGFLIGPAGERKISELVTKHFRYADEGSIAADVMEIELRQQGRTLAQQRAGVTGAFKNAQDVLLKGFQAGEMINRSVTAHALARRAAREGLDAAGTQRLIRNGVSATQFASEPLSTPRLFLGDSGALPLKLDNPLFRQFLTFPTRMTTGLVHSMPLAKSEGQGFTRALVGDSLRAMGLSAATYEVGKELFGADLSYATLTGAALSGVFREYGPGAPLPLPPAVTLPLSAIQAMQQGDMELMRYTLPTLLPGGVAATRALGLLPKTPLTDLGGIQRSYVDYTRKTPDGRYPVFTPDGRVVSYETLTALMAKAGGVDMGRFRDESELIGYLGNIREETLSYRKDFIRALVTNDLPKAQKVAREYQNKFGNPLKVNESQIKSFLQLQSQSRLERTFDSLPRGVKDLVGGTIEQTISPGRLGLAPGGIASGQTASRRTRVTGAEMPAEVRQIIQRQLQANQEAVRAQQQQPKTGYGAYTPFGRTP